MYHIRIMYIYISEQKKRHNDNSSRIKDLHTKRHRPGGALLYAAHSPSNAWATVVRHPWFSKGEASEVGEDLNVGMFL